MRFCYLAIIGFLLPAAAQAGYYDSHLLTKADVELYLSVMDKAAIQVAQRPADHKSCDKQGPAPANQSKEEAMKRLQAAADCVDAFVAAVSVDDDIAKAQGVAERYAPVKEGIEELIRFDPASKDGIGPVRGRACLDDCTPKGMEALKGDFAKVGAMHKRNRDFLMPYQARIQRVEFVVRRAT